jgi:hypothetical protein
MDPRRHYHHGSVAIIVSDGTQVSLAYVDCRYKWRVRFVSHVGGWIEVKEKDAWPPSLMWVRRPTPILPADRLTPVLDLLDSSVLVRTADGWRVFLNGKLPKKVLVRLCRAMRGLGGTRIERKAEWFFLSDPRPLLGVQIREVSLDEAETLRRASD